ncbi:hypothetical protein PROFUN_04870 [Planoprotostelium fungivorum]|uniref:Uncharacterized protein n=1 Tax=Planoprotostelium fungivorum TaxID=1890364 RepID=A0A2P6NF59_9EUKA|nr:hypothetical protein PROFUN_04870 [Planoprotostelium fungivorum]
MTSFGASKNEWPRKRGTINHVDCRSSLPIWADFIDPGSGIPVGAPCT